MKIIYKTEPRVYTVCVYVMCRHVCVFRSHPTYRLLSQICACNNTYTQLWWEERGAHVSTNCCNYVLYNWMLTLAALLQRRTARGWRLTQLAKSYVWYGRNEIEKGKEQREKERRYRVEGSSRGRSSSCSTLLHTELRCHSFPPAPHIKWHQAGALWQQAPAAPGMVPLLLHSAGQSDNPCLQLTFTVKDLILINTDFLGPCYF